MNTYFLNNYSLDIFEVLTFPLLSPYAHRHWKETNTASSISSTVFHFTVSLIEAIPVIGLIASIIEGIAYIIFDQIGMLNPFPYCKKTPILLFNQDEYADGTHQDLEKLFKQAYPNAQVALGSFALSPETLLTPESQSTLTSLKNQYHQPVFFHVATEIRRCPPDVCSEELYQRIDNIINSRMHIIFYRIESSPLMENSKRRKPIQVSGSGFAQNCKVDESEKAGFIEKIKKILENTENAF